MSHRIAMEIKRLIPTKYLQSHRVNIKLGFPVIAIIIKASKMRLAQKQFRHKHIGLGRPGNRHGNRVAEGLSFVGYLMRSMCLSQAD